MRFASYLDNLQASGRYCFTAAEALRALGISTSAFLSAVKRMKKKGRVASPGRQFYIIIPPEQLHLGCLPAEEFVPHLMKFWDLQYYVCLLSAAEYYGAAHQRPQRFQVMTTSYIPNIVCGNVSVEFIQKKSIESIPVKNINTPRSIIRVSTLEATAIDLVNHITHAGGLNHIATVLTELSEAMDPMQLSVMADQTANTSCLQRLGYLLEAVGQNDLSLVIKEVLKKRTCRTIALNAQSPFDKLRKNDFWRLYINFNIEAEI